MGDADYAADLLVDLEADIARVQADQHDVLEAAA